VEGWIDASGWVVCGVVFARDVMRVDSAVASANEVVDSSKHKVGGPISAVTLPPSFDNATVVTVDLEVIPSLAPWEERSDEEFEANGFGPPNVSTISFPAREEEPCSP
jgi:hypothetical protein